VVVEHGMALVPGKSDLFLQEYWMGYRNGDIA